MGTIQSLIDLVETYEVTIELIEWYGSNHIPKHMGGRKKIEHIEYKSKSPKVTIEIDHGGEALSNISVGHHQLIQFIPPQLRIYAPQSRDLTPQEQQALDKAARIETDEARKMYLTVMGYSYLVDRREKWATIYYDVGTNKIIDNGARGQRLLVFNIHRGGRRDDPPVAAERHKRGLMRYREAQIEAIKCGRIGYCTSGQLSKITGKSREIIERWRDEGLVKAIKGENGIYFYDMDSVLGFIASQDAPKEDQDIYSVSRSPMSKLQRHILIGRMIEDEKNKKIKWD